MLTLAREHGTAAYVLDEDDFRSRAAEFRDGFASAFEPLAGADVYYAGKAFLCTAVARWVADEGLHLDVCTGGELAVARAGAVPRRSGSASTATTRPPPRSARRSSYGVGRIVVDSFHEIDRIAAVAAELGVVAPVMVRVTVGVEAHTHEFIATGHEDQKFGFSLAGGQALEAAAAPAGPARRVRPARPAQPHRQPDLRHRRLRDGGPPAGRPARPDRRRARPPLPRDRPRRRLRHRLHLAAHPAVGRDPGAGDGRHRRARAQGGRRRRQHPRARGSRSSPAAPSSARAPSPSTRSAPSRTSRSAAATPAPTSRSTAG